MPIKINNDLPAKRTLEQENIFIMAEDRATKQDIRPLKLLILNLMPKKIETETQLLRLLGNSPLQLEIELLQVKSHVSKNTSKSHLQAFYKCFDDVRRNRYDGLIITGAPVEHLPFEEVDYYDELCEIMEWSKTNVYSTFHICWGAQAGLYYHYGIKKYPLEKKLFGVFEHKPLNKKHNLLRGFDDVFWVPQSRHTTVRANDIKRTPGLYILSASDEAGVYIVADKSCRQFFVTGHSEYNPDTLANEYFRDLKKGLPIDMPKNYFPDDDPTKKPVWKWKSHANLMFSNWLNYFVYQQTPFDLSEL